MKSLFRLMIFLVIGLSLTLYSVTGTYVDTTGVEISQIRGTSLAAQWALIDGFIEAHEQGVTTATKCEFKSVGIASTKTSGGGAATGTGGDENLLLLPEAMFEYHILGTQTILQPAITGTGLNIAMDQTDNDGVEISQGILAGSKHAYTVGTDGAVYFKVTYTIADVTGCDDFLIGFRKAEAYQADPDGYDEMAAFNIQAGQIEIHTIINAAATTETDTTEDDAIDASQHTYEVRVSAAGVVTFLYDGAAPTATATFTFDDTEVIVPFLMQIQHGDVSGAITLDLWECGPLL
jgi:hypothetical protein